MPWAWGGGGGERGWQTFRGRRWLLLEKRQAFRRRRGRLPARAACGLLSNVTLVKGTTKLAMAPWGSNQSSTHSSHRDDGVAHEEGGGDSGVARCGLLHRDSY